MEPCRASAISEFDAPRASVGRDVATYLSLVADEQVRYVDALASATALLGDHRGGLMEAAALQVRLSQQFVDAQRSILRMWADTDAKVARITETAALEAAVLGLEVDGMFDIEPTVDGSVEHDLRRLLNRCWEVARLDSVQAIERAQAETDHWIEVARLAAGPTGGHAPNEERTGAADTDAEAAPADDSAGPTRATLPAPIEGALTRLGDAPVLALLDALAALLDAGDDLSDETTPASDLSEVPSVHEQSAADRFDRFWVEPAGAVAGHGMRAHRIVRDAVVPMFVVALVLVLTLALIG